MALHLLPRHCEEASMDPVTCVAGEIMVIVMVMLVMVMRGEGINAPVTFMVTVLSGVWCL